MRDNITHLTGSDSMTTDILIGKDLPPGLPPNVVRALWLLDRLDAQADQIRHSVDEMVASVSAAPSR